jgi:hypothetical protein
MTFFSSAVIGATRLAMGLAAVPALVAMSCLLESAPPPFGDASGDLQTAL